MKRSCPQEVLVLVERGQWHYELVLPDDTPFWDKIDRYTLVGYKIVPWLDELNITHPVFT